MERKDLSFIKDKDTLDLIQHIFENGQGTVLILESAPTAALPVLSENQWGIYNDILYHRSNGKIYVYTAGSVLTIT